MATIFWSWVYTKSCRGEQSAFKVSLSIQVDGRGLGSRGLLSRSLSALFLRPGICFLTSFYCPASRRRVGVKQLSWGSLQQEGPKILCQALISLGQLCLLLIKSFRSQGRSLGALCVGAGCLKNCLLAILYTIYYIQSYAVFARQRLDLGRRWDKKEWLEQKTVPFSSTGRWKWGNLSF